MKAAELHLVMHGIEGRQINRSILTDSALSMLTWAEGYKLQHTDLPSADLFKAVHNVTLPEKLDAYEEVNRLVVQAFAEVCWDKMLDEAEQIEDYVDRFQFVRNEGDRILSLVVSIDEVAFMSDFEERLRQYEADVLAGKTTKVCGFGFSTLDEELNGFEEQDLVVLIARYSAGKSTFARKVAVNARLQGQRVLYIALEESKDATLKMMDAALAGVPARDYLYQKLSEAQIEQIRQAGQEYAGVGEIVVVGDLEPRNVTSIYATILKHKPDLVIVDQLAQLVVDSDWKEYTKTTRILKQICMRSRVPIMMLAQSSKSGEAKYSESIGQDADKMLKLSDDPKEITQTKKVRVEKNRRGRRFFDIELEWNLAEGKVGELGAPTADPYAGRTRNKAEAVDAQWEDKQSWNKTDWQ